MAVWDKLLKERADIFTAFTEEQLTEIEYEPIMCKQFGCGKSLSLNEQLHGGYCLFHQPEKHQPDKRGDDEDDDCEGCNKM